MLYRNCGRSGLKLPVISLGLWQNFGANDSFQNAKAMIHRAFDLGVTHFDLANNYGPPGGTAEQTLAKVMQQGLGSYRDELIITNKAGYYMWPGHYGGGGSRKHLMASIDQSLKRTGLSYFDIFYSHCPDPDTPVEETMVTLDHIVRSGRALYVGLSSYDPTQTRTAVALLRELGTPCVVHQPRYSLFDRSIESGLVDVLSEEHVGTVVFSPLSQGLLTNKYLKGIPKQSRAARDDQVFLQEDDITDDRLEQIRRLNEIANDRGQTLAQMAIAWVLRDPVVTSAIIGASRVDQIEDCIRSQDNLDFSQEELDRIDTVLTGSQSGSD